MQEKYKQQRISNKN